MKKLLSVLLVLVFLLILVVVGGGVAGYFYLKSDAVKSKLETTLSKYTTTPVTIDSLSFSMSGITLEGLVIPNESPLTDQFLNTKAFEVELQWLSLLDPTPAIDALRIGQPALIMHQSTEGGMKLPLRGAGDGTGTGKTQESESEMDLLLKLLDVQGASFQAYDPDGEALIQLAGVNLNGDVKRLAGDWVLTSTLSAEELLAGPYLTVTEVKSPLTMAAKLVSLPEISGSFYQGTMNGSSAVDLNPDDPVFSFELDAADADMDLLMQGMGKEAGFMQGVLAFNVSGQGKASAPKELKGMGEFTIIPAMMPKLQAAKVLGSILGVKLIQDGTFKEVKGTFTLHDQLVDFSQLQVLSENVSIELTGTVSFSKELDLKGEVILEPGATAVFAKLFGGTADQIRKETRKIPLSIVGPADTPKVKVDTVQVGLDAGKSLLNRFLFKPEDTTEPLPGQEAVPPAEQDPLESVDSILKGFMGE